MLGELGNERTEILKTSPSTGPTGTYKEITFASAMKFDHPQDTKITVIEWDRIEFSHAATVGGSKTTLRAYPLEIMPDQLETYFVDTTKSSGFYFVRFNETIGNTNSDYSDPIPYAGFDDNTVFMIKKRALDDLKEEVDGDIITHEFLDDCLWQARREYHNAEGKRPFRRINNAAIGVALTGSFRIELPLDAERPFTAENVYGVRIGANANMKYMDKKEFDFQYVNVPHSTLDVPYVKGVSTSIWLANGRDFSASAVITIEGTSLQLSRIVGSQNSFTIISHGSWSGSGGSDVWENASYGLPDRFTVFASPEGSAFIYFNRPIETAYVNQNIFADYYRTVIDKDSDADVLDEPEFDMFVDYLKAKIKYRRNKGETDITKDPDYKLWELKKERALSKEYGGVTIRMAPGIDHLPLP